jgi:uncharacterized protein (DUF58 family)
MTTAATTAMVSRFLDLRALAALEHLRFTTTQRLEGTYSGRHPSRRHGGAGEFADFREYADGEDLRRLDWKVLARTGRAYTRLYQDETNLVCTLTVDASASMAYGRGGTKLEYLQYLATAFTHVIGRQQDHVGLAVVADKLHDFYPPGSTAGHIAHLQTIIEKLPTWPVTELAKALRELFQRVTRRGALIVLSDFLTDDLEAVFAAFRLFRHRRWEVILLHLVHPEEERLPQGAAYRFEGLENEGRVDCSPAEIRRLYEERFESHAAMLRTLALGAGCDYRRVSTAIPYLRTLGGFLVERAG